MRWWIFSCVDMTARWCGVQEFDKKFELEDIPLVDDLFEETYRIGTENTNGFAYD